MSEAPPEGIDIPRGGDAAFGALMDALVPAEAPEKKETPAGAVEEPAAGAAAADGEGAAAGAPAGEPAAPAEGSAAADAGAVLDTETGDPAIKAAAGVQPAEPAGQGDDAAAGTGGEPAAGGAGDRPAAWTAPAAELIPKIGKLSTALEERTVQAYQKAALEEVRTEHAQYFAALDKHPRTLIGEKVPAVGKEGFETLKDAEDAKDWQDAVKSLLVGEVRDRASKQMDENADFLTTLHASIELFQNNSDLVPGSKEFDVELANRFSTFVTPYELRVEGKLQGYSIAVQPIIDQLRTQLAAERAAKPAAPAPAAGSAPSSQKADPPQAGIQSKATSGDQAEDFSTLFGTIGLPNLQI